MAEMKSFASDACWVVIDRVQGFLGSPDQQRWCIGVTAYLLASFLIGNAMSEAWNICLSSAA